MSVIDDRAVTRRARGKIARRRGALIGLILVILGAWGALIPFIGPYFHYAYTPDHAWRWTASRGWLEVLPGAVTAFGGLLVLSSRSRATAVLGAWLSAAGGAWFAIGTSFEPIFHTGAVGTPAGGTSTLRVLETIGFFYGLGVVIVFFAATASGRLSVRSLADIHVAQRELDAEAAAKASNVDAIDDTSAGRHESEEQDGDSAPEPMTVEHRTAGDNTDDNTAGPADAAESEKRLSYRPAVDEATAPADIDPIESQPEETRAGR